MPKIVKTIYEDQDELLASMVGLHSGGAVELDPTYGRGMFYRYTLEPPRLKFDIAPRRPGVIAADVTRLPLRDEAVSSIVFDPPFLATTAAIKGTGKMRGQYKEIAGTAADLRVFYQVALIELYRVISPAGILYFKCQDCAHDHNNHFNHVFIYNEAERLGFRAVDFFILVAKTRPIQTNLFKQKHARKYHCYFWVFKKPARR